MNHSMLYPTIMDDSELINYLESKFIDINETRDPKAEKAKCHKYIPARRSDFRTAISAAHTLFQVVNGKPPQSFLDVGCGLGTKLIMVNHAFRQIDGIEFDSGYAEKARELTKLRDDRITIIETDALKFNGYQNYDIIYFYTPINDRKKQILLETRIIRRAKAGAIIVPFAYTYHGASRLWRGKKVTRIPLYESPYPLYLVNKKR